MIIYRVYEVIAMCCEPGRRFLTKEEKIEKLNSYKDALEKEAKGVAERIQQLQKS